MLKNPLCWSLAHTSNIFVGRKLKDHLKLVTSGTRRRKKTCYRRSPQFVIVKSGSHISPHCNIRIQPDSLRLVIFCRRVSNTLDIPEARQKITRCRILRFCRLLLWCLLSLLVCAGHKTSQIWNTLCNDQFWMFENTLHNVFIKRLQCNDLRCLEMSRSYKSERPSRVFRVIRVFFSQII